MSKLPHQAEGVGEERGVEAPGGVLADHPGLKGGEQERGGDAAEEPATRQDPEVVEQLGATERFGRALVVRSLSNCPPHRRRVGVGVLGGVIAAAAQDEPCR